MDSPGIIVAFWVLSGITIAGGLMVMLARNLMHAIIFLIVSFLGMAGLFLTLSADFIAIAQVLIYVGAISVLLVFAMMLTPLASRDNSNSVYALPGMALGVLFAAIVGFVAVDVEWPELTGAALDARSFSSTVEAIGDALLGPYVLAFEVASVLLLAALIGAIVLVHEEPEAASAAQSPDDREAVA